MLRLSRISISGKLVGLVLLTVIVVGGATFGSAESEAPRTGTVPATTSASSIAIRSPGRNRRRLTRAPATCDEEGGGVLVPSLKGLRTRLLFLLVVAFALGRIPASPLTSGQWVLLGLGLSVLPAVAALVALLARAERTEALAAGPPGLVARGVRARLGDPPRRAVCRPATSRGVRHAAG